MTLFLFWLLLQDPAGVTALAVAPDGTRALGGHAGVRIGDRKLGESRVVTSLAFSPDGRFLAEGGGRAAESGVVRVWEVAGGTLLWSATDARDLITSVCWAPDGTLFAASADRQILRYGADGRVKATLLGHSGPVLCAGVSPDGSTLATGGADRTVRVWSVAKNAWLRTLSSHSEPVQCLAWSPDSKHLASGSKDRSIRIFQPGIGRLVRIVRDHGAAEITALAWSADGKRLASGASDGKVRIIDGASALILAKHEGHADWITALAATQDGFVAADWSGVVKEWPAVR